MSVKDKKRGRPAEAKRSLSSESIIKQAKQLMEQDGKVPSIRHLALTLGVDAMAIYHYFKNKNALLDAMTVSLMNDIYEPTLNEDWEGELKRLCVSYLELLDKYSGLLETLLSLKSQGPTETFTIRFNTVVHHLKLEENTANDALGLLVDYLHGFALAMKCNPDRNSLNSEMISGAIKLYCLAIRQQ